MPDGIEIANRRSYRALRAIRYYVNPKGRERGSAVNERARQGTPSGWREWAEGRCSRLPIRSAVVRALLSMRRHPLASVVLPGLACHLPLAFPIGTRFPVPIGNRWCSRATKPLGESWPAAVDSWPVGMRGAAKGGTLPR